MRIGGSLFLIAVGAILAFAIADRVDGVNLVMIGVILMIVGGIGLLLSVVMATSRRRTDVIHEGGAVYGGGAAAPVAAPVASRTTYVEPPRGAL